METPSKTDVYYCVAPHRISEHDTAQGALAAAMWADRAAESSYGPGAGADCWIVRDHAGKLDLRGMACGRRLISPPQNREFGCSHSVCERVAKFIAA